MAAPLSSLGGTSGTQNGAAWIKGLNVDAVTSLMAPLIKFQVSIMLI
ncbi:MAG: hypothetical protein V3U82_00470 [Robiginitomaculum sp.]